MNRSISFVIPAFNARLTIGETIRSVLAQTHAQFEVIVVDDGSTDGTFEEVSRVSDRRVTLVRRPNQGVARSRNLGLSIARHEYACFLDADDALLPEFASQTLGSLGENDAISTAYLDTDPTLRPASRAWRPAHQELRLDRLRTENPLAIGATVFRTDSLREVARHFGETFPSDSHVEDWEMLLRFTSLGGRWAAPIERPLMLCRLLPDSRSTQAERIWHDGLRLIRHWVPALERPDAERNWTLGQLAKALANNLHEPAAGMLQSINQVQAADLPALAGALRVWARRIKTVRGERVSSPDLESRLISLGRSPAAQLTAMALAPEWSDLAVRAAKSLALSERLVVYGFGHNGREACRALDDLGMQYAIIDDDPAFQHPRRMVPADLTERHVVLITPDRHNQILHSLRSCPVERVLTSKSLLGPSYRAA